MVGPEVRLEILSSGMILHLGSSLGKYVRRLSTRGWLRFLEVRYTTELFKPPSQLGPCALSQPNLRTFEGKYPAAHPG